MLNEWVVRFQDITLKDIEHVGGKNASLGEMIQYLHPIGIKIPQGFATTANAYKKFLSQDKLDEKIYQLLSNLDVNDINQLQATGRQIRQWILESTLPQELVNHITEYYNIMKQQVGAHLSVAVRSSATAEDLPNASFAGQQETILNVQGIENVLNAVKEVYASLFNDRAISYRIYHGFRHEEVAISIGIQQMIRSDLAASGVMFTIDTESGFDQVVLINSSFGLGELLVQGAVNPDEFYVSKSAILHKKNAVISKKLGSKQQKMIYGAEDNSSMSSTSSVPPLEKTVSKVEVPKQEQLSFSLSDEELELLAKQALLIENHYGRPMDIEWAKDGITQEFYIIQARPETVTHQSSFSLERYELNSTGKILIEGRSVGLRIGKGVARVIHSLDEMKQLQPGEVLVTDMTDPDWEPIMKRAAAIVTNRGGRTCHAAIIARELGIPAVVGCGKATQVITDGQPVTVSCAEGDTGFVYQGLLDYEVKHLNIESLPEIPFKIMMTIGNPERAFDFRKFPNAGVGLARLEFIINHMIGIHPRACLEWKDLPETLQEEVLEKTAAYQTPVDFYVNKITEGVATLAAAFWPKPVVVRLSDFKSNEYANLLGGSEFEPKEENPMLGFRGACRYLSESFKESFSLECRALRKVREEFGLTNVEIMIPFVRTPLEAKQVVELLAEQGLVRGNNGLRLIMMCEIPSNALLAEEFLQYFDGFSIGSNDLTQLTLGLDRDSGLVAHHFDERNAAVKILLQKVIETCKRLKKSISICGQGPSDHPDFAEWLMERGIDSISLNPDSILSTWMVLGKGVEA